MSSDFENNLNFSKAKQAAQSGGAEGVDSAAQRLLKKSQPHVPVDEGELKSSGYVVVNGSEASVVYDAPHAVFVHEDLEAHHDQGSAKFLEKAIEPDELLTLIAEKLRGALR